MSSLFIFSMWNPLEASDMLAWMFRCFSLNFHSVFIVMEYSWYVLCICFSVCSVSRDKHLSFMTHFNKHYGFFPFFFYTKYLTYSLFSETYF